MSNIEVWPLVCCVIDKNDTVWPSKIVLSHGSKTLLPYKHGRLQFHWSYISLWPSRITFLQRVKQVWKHFNMCNVCLLPCFNSCFYVHNPDFAPKGIFRCILHFSNTTSYDQIFKLWKLLWFLLHFQPVLFPILRQKVVIKH